jgi:hypothetical protein
MGAADWRADIKGVETGWDAVAPFEEVLPFPDEGDASETWV